MHQFGNHENSVLEYGRERERGRKIEEEMDKINTLDRNTMQLLSNKTQKNPKMLQGILRQLMCPIFTGNVPRIYQ